MLEEVFLPTSDVLLAPVALSWHVRHPSHSSISMGIIVLQSSRGQDAALNF